MNRYIYAENDPIQNTDANGMRLTASGGLALALLTGVLALTFFLGGPLLFLAAVAGMIAGFMFAMFYQMGNSRCALRAADLDWDEIFWAALGGAMLGLAGPTIAGGYLGGFISTALTNLALWGGAAGALASYSV